ncbi:hypothetical protein [Vallitalea okinawensis]|uniref:hypothetical protein n=1 Tax=Vallitalea okinawensis TaxID=2078660 RepID=UPI000CFD1C28|nr:hypothetical protein [Vallitalea okinawensis]
MGIPKVRVSNENKIKIYRHDLRTCKRQTKVLQEQLQQDLSTIDHLKIDRELKTVLYQVEVLQRKLSELGFKDNRGRPKKMPEDKYAANRTKFTAMLNTDNLDYIKQLKSDGQINNISAFLDELILKHRVQSLQKNHLLGDLT